MHLPIQLPACLKNALVLLEVSQWKLLSATESWEDLVLRKTKEPFAAKTSRQKNESRQFKFLTKDKWSHSSIAVVPLVSSCWLEKRQAYTCIVGNAEFETRQSSRKKRIWSQGRCSAKNQTCVGVKVRSEIFKQDLNFLKRCYCKSLFTESLIRAPDQQ